VQLWRKLGAQVDREPADGHSEVHELAGSTATESNFRIFAPGRYAIHVATHGFFLGVDCTGRQEHGASEPDEITLAGLMADSPLLLSGLALAGANTRDRAPSTEDDGILTAEEIVSMNLAGVEWVVLSACETGLGKIESGEGVFGLRRAFQIAGVRNLVMSLWAVNDSETALWMGKMFEERLRGGNTVAESVREASLAVLRHRRAEGLSTHPYYWGAFVATGG
jgi:CHAT domain-containing protein